MNSGLRMLLASALSVAIALSITWVEGAGPFGPGGSVLPVFQQKLKRLTNDNLVDKLAPLSLQLDIAKVDWNEPTLAIDLTAASGLSQEEIYGDLLQLVRLGMKQTSNVDQLLIRVMQKPSGSSVSGGSRLLLTMDARRDRFKDDERNSGNGSTLGAGAKQLLQRETDITYTGSWKDRFGG